MNNPFHLTTRTNQLIGIILGLCILACTPKQDIKTDIPIVRLAPKEAGTLKVSDFFDSYKLYQFKDSLFSGIDDFMELGNKRIAILNYFSGDRNSSPKKLVIFDTLGNFLYQIGSVGRGPGEYLSMGSSIQIKKDSSFDIIDLNNNKYLNYSLENKVNKEQLPLYIKDGAFPGAWLNDSLLLMHYYDNETSLKSLQHYIYLTIQDKQIIHKKYLPADPSKKEFIIKTGSPYKINDTICIYSEENACIYNILADTITPRYYFDKGKHTGFIKIKEMIHEKTDDKILWIESCENNKYLFGHYFYNQKIYYYIYDKSKKITYNYKNVNDDLVFMNDKKQNVWPSQVVILSRTPTQVSDKYLHMPFSQSSFRNLIENIKNNVTPREWENYRKTHQDIIAAYENYNEETSNPVIIGFKYK